MAEGLKCPSMSWETGDDQAALKEYKKRLERWFKIKKIKKEEQHDYIVFQAGEKGEERLATWDLTADDLKDPDKVWGKFEQSVGLADNFRVHRLNLMSFKQNDGETIDEFYTRCRGLALKCQFKDIEDRIIDQLILGTKLMESRKDLLSQGNDLKLEEALKKCRTHEASEAHMRAFSQIGSASAQVDAVQTKSPETRKEHITNCKFCAREHPFGKCPAFHTTCTKCGKKGHWRIRCHSSPNTSQGQEIKSVRTQPGYERQERKPERKQIRALQVQAGDEEYAALQFESIQISAMSSAGRMGQDIMAQVDVQIPGRANRAQMLCKVDTGAQGNILPVRTFKEMCPQLIDRNGFPILGDVVRTNQWVKLTAANGTTIPQHGMVDLKIRYSPLTQQWISREFFIADTPGPILLGSEASRSLHIVKVDASLDKVTVAVVKQTVPGDDKIPIPDNATLQRLYPDRFEGLGKFPGQYHLQVKPDVEPVIRPARKYPIHLKPEIQDEINKMVELDVIEPVPMGECTEWLSALAFSRKDSGKLRVCLDPKDLNEAIKRTYHKTPTIEEITHKLSGARVFSKIDARHGYWSVQLDSESSKMTSFSGPDGRYRFKRLPFGIKVAQDIFQEKMDAILASCPGTLNISDDILVFGSSDEDHDRNLHNLMHQARGQGLVFNPEKCVIRATEVEFFGMIYTRDGVRPSERKAQEIAELPSPKTVRELQQFLGMVQYMAGFLPNLSSQTAILRSLTKDVEWTWDGSHEAAFQALKESIRRAVTLTYFDPTKQTTIQVDASKRGLGAALIQKGSDGKEKVIAFASKALSDTEERYANIERELLAVVFGVERFHTYVYGSTFHVESDHKPLESIQKMSLGKAPPRLQRMLLRLQPYDFSIVYRPGKELMLADAMSRLHPRQAETLKLERTIHSVKWSDCKMQQLQRETAMDAELGPLLDIVCHGWPDKAHDLPKALRPYWSFKDFISVEDGVLMKGPRVIIPKCLQGEILAKLHESHQGIEKTRLRAQTCVYWRGVDKDIEDMVSACHICLEYGRKMQKETLLQYNLPSGPWQQVGTDLFEMDGQTFLIVADYYSKMPFVRKITTQTSRMVVAKLKTIFGEHGVPEVVHSDGGPCYSSREFGMFAEAWGFRHIMSSPNYPQSNGFIERMIQTIKLTLKKAKRSGTDPELALLCVRATPIDHKIGSPTDLLYRRTVRTNLPAKIRGDEHTVEALRLRQEQQKTYYDQGAKDRPDFCPGQQVGLQDPHSLKWMQAKVLERCQEPRSYLVQTQSGATLRRNKQFLRDMTPRDQIPGTPRLMNATPDNTEDDNLVKHVEMQQNNTTHQCSVARDRPKRTVKPPERLIQTM